MSQDEEQVFLGCLQLLIRKTNETAAELQLTNRLVREMAAALPHVRIPANVLEELSRACLQQMAPLALWHAALKEANSKHRTVLDALEAPPASWWRAAAPSSLDDAPGRGD